MTKKAKSTRKLGAEGEEAGVAFLIARGYQILERNVRSPFGEIDIIAKDRKYLVFIEVKLRTNSQFGIPEESVTEIKKQKLIRSAAWYLATYRQVNVPARFDVLSIQKSKLGSDQFRLIQDAFQG